MRNGIRTAGLCLLLALGLGGCSPTSPSSLPLTAATAVLPPVVQPPATPQLGGWVQDTAGRPVAGARVEVLDGPHAGLATIADAFGRFSLPGTFDGTTRFRATGEGHVAGTESVRLNCATCSPAAYIVFTLELLTPQVNIAGNYNVTIIADNACSRLPAEMRARTYMATIRPAASADRRANTSFEVVVSGAPFLAQYESFRIDVAGDYLSGSVGWRHDNLPGYHDEPGLVEEVGTNTYLAVGGWFSASVADTSAISAPFDAFIDYCALPAPMGSVYSCGPGESVVHSECTSTSHQLLLTRR